MTAGELSVLELNARGVVIFFQFAALAPKIALVVNSM